MRTTGMNPIVNPREQSLSESALLEGWFFFFFFGLIVYFVILTF